MNWLACIAKSYLIIGFLIFIYRYFLANSANFQFNRFFLLFALVASLITPLLQFNLPIDEAGSLASINFKQLNFIAIHLNTNTNSAVGSFHYWILVEKIYFIIALSLLLRSLFQFYRLSKRCTIYRRSTNDFFDDGIVFTNNISTPFTFILTTYLPISLKNDPDLEVILMHEKTHRKQLHFIDIVLITLFNNLLFLNPFQHYLKKAISINHEFLADQHTVKNYKRKRYEAALIKLTLDGFTSYKISHFAKPSIYRRLKMLEQTHGGISKHIVVSIILSFTFCVLLSFKLNISDSLSMPAQNTGTERSDDQTIFTIVEKQAEPKGGIQHFYARISTLIKAELNVINEASKKAGVVYVRFVIEKDGSLSNIEAVKGVNKALDALATQAVNNAGSWSPGLQKNKKVRSQRVVPIRFTF